MHKYQNAFLFEDSEIVKSVIHKENFFYVEFDDTIFYPGGGGQPCDTGIIKNSSFFSEVIDVIKEKDKVIHKIIAKKGTLAAGDQVDLEVDKDRRIRLVKMHTGEHILFRSLELALGDIRLNKIDLGENESSLFIITEKLDWGTLLKAEGTANRIISEDRKIIEKEFTWDEIERMGKLRIKPERIRAEKVRVVEIQDFDWSACTGTHAHSTGFVANLLIIGFGISKEGWEIRFKADALQDLFALSGIAREASSYLQTDASSLISSITKLKDEAEIYKGKFRSLSYQALDNYKKENVGKIDFIYNITEDLEKKQLAVKAAELLKDNIVVCFINKTAGKATIMLSSAPGLDMPQLLIKVLSRFGGKGGGRDNFASGSFEATHIEEVLAGIKSELSSF